MRHGGDIYRNPIQLDYSVNINPLGIPESVTQALMDAVGCCTQYPDILQEQLKKALADYEKLDPANIVCGNGASELFVAVEHVIKSKKTLIPVPSFYGYEHASHTENSEIVYYPMKADKNYVLDDEILTWLSNDIDLLYLANPNNPTGQLIPVTLLNDILERCEDLGIYVVLDECFLPFCEEEESYVQLFSKKIFSNLIRIRAFTKTFSIPGVRLGYLICTDLELKKKIEVQIPEWNLSIFAQKAGTAAAYEQDFLEQSRALIAQERQWLIDHLTELGFRVIPSATNFILFHGGDELYDKMLNQGILIRDCSNFQGLSKGDYRIAVKTREENERLIDAIEADNSQRKQEESIPNSSRFFANRECAYYPCHKGLKALNCMFCYCPFYLREYCPGRPEFIEHNGKRIKSCENCTFPHQAENYDKIMEILRNS